MHRLILILVLLFSINSYSVQIIYDTQKKEWILSGAPENLPEEAHIVFGEEHYHDRIPLHMASMISNIHRQNKNIPINVGWEFLNYTDQAKIDNAFNSFRTKKINEKELLKKLFPNSKNHQENEKYKWIMTWTQYSNGRLLGMNAPRAWKRKLIKEGLNALLPEQIPPHHYTGGPSYYARFKQAMKGHLGEKEIEAYFEAQCYTDSVIANQMNKMAPTGRSFLIIGGFHSEYNMGVIERLELISKKPVVNIKFVDSRNMSDKDIENYIQPNFKYGNIADYISFVK